MIAFLGVTPIAKSQPGTLDQDFGTQSGYTLTSFFNGGVGYHGIAIQSDGRIVVAGDEHKGNKAVFVLARYNSNGELDTSFGSGGKVFTDFDGGNDRARPVAIQNNGKIVVAGYAYNGSNYDFALARYNQDGKPDNGFGDRGKLVIAFGERNDYARSMVLQPDGMILVAGEVWKEENGISSDFAIARYKSNGKQPDKDFGSDGIVITDFEGGDDKARAMAVQPDGKIIVAGQSYESGKGFFSLVRYNTNGSLDTSFGNRGDGKVLTALGSGNALGISMVLQPDGKILLTGEASNGSNQDFALARYNSNGLLDASFGSGGKVLTDFGGSNDQGRTVVLQAGGKIIVAGQAKNGSREDAALARYNPDGSLDTSFGDRGDGKVVANFGGENESVNASVIVGEQLLLAGYSGSGVDTEEALLAAYLLAEEEVEDVLLSVVVEKDAAEDDKDGFFEISVSKALATDVSLGYSLSGIAQRGSDYSTEPEADEVVLKAGKTSIKVKISPKADSEVEEEETVVLALANPTIQGLELDEAKKSATLNITDDDEEIEEVLLSVARGKDAAEPAEHGHFIISASPAPAEDLTIGFGLSGTAVTADYSTTLAKQEVVLPAGQTTVQVPIQVIDDAEVEEEETVILTLNTPDKEGVLVDESNKTATVQITDNDEEPEDVFLSVTKDKDAAEDNVNGEFIISLSSALEEALTIGYGITGTATEGSDYKAVGGQVVLPAGQTSVKVAIEVVADLDVEPEETVILTLQVPTVAGVVLNPEEGKQNASLSIIDNDEEVEDILLSVASGKDATEPDEHGYFIVSATAAPREDLLISINLTGTAVEGADYETVGQQVRLEAGQTSVQVPVQVKDDAEVEAVETVVLALQAPAIAGVALDPDQNKQQASLSIQDNDEEPVPAIVLSVAKGADAAEPDQAGQFIISASAAPREDLSISYTFAGTATAGQDYTAPAEQVVLPAGQTSINVPIAVTDDQEVEEEETVILALEVPAATGIELDETRKSATLTITDNDEEIEEVLLSVAVVKDAEEDNKDGEFEISLSNTLAEDLTISYSIAGTAAAGTDYEAPEEQLVLKAGKKSEKIKIKVAADTEVEEEETVILTLQPSGAAGVLLDEAKKEAILKILDNDEEPVEVEPALLSVVVDKDAAEDDKDGAFALQLSKALENDLVVTFSISGTAQRGSDYTTAPEEDQVVLKAGKTTEKVQVKIIADTEVEEAETVVLRLQAPATAEAVLDDAKQEASLKIEDDDEEVAEDILLSVAAARDAAEPDQDGHFVISASSAPDNDLTIGFNLSGTAGTDDYSTTLAKQEVVLMAGQTTVQVPVQVKDDAEVEGEEGVVLGLLAPTINGVVLDENAKTAALKIKDNDEEEEDLALLSVRVGEDAAEDAEDGYFLISSSLPLLIDVPLYYSISGTATAGADFDSPGQQVILPAGQTSVRVPIAVQADTEIEEAETVILTLQSPSLLGLMLDEAGKVATMMIEDDDEEVVEDVLLSVVVEKEAAEDDKDGFFELAVSQALPADVTISYQLSGTAQKGSDYSTEPEADEVVLKAGKTSVKVKISPNADTEAEEEETVVLTLVPPAVEGLVLDESRKSASLAITDNDDEAVEEVLLSVAMGKAAAEPDEHGYFIINATAALQADLPISISLSGTATEGADYEATEQVVLMAGQTSVQVPVQVIDDAAVEEEETVILTLNAPTGEGVALEETAKSASLTIQDDDEEPVPAVVLSVAKGADAAEPDQEGQFIISASAALQEDLTIGYSISGTAIAAEDYTAPAEQVVLKAGQTSVNVAITVSDDEEIEEEETVILALEVPAATGVELDETRKSASLAIKDNDEEVEPAVLSVVVTKDAEEDNKDGEFEISLSEALAEDLLISYSLTGTAAAGADYEAPEGQLVLKAGKKKEKIKIKVLADTEVEEEETVILTLQPSAVAGVVLDEAKHEATLIILDNDEEDEEVADVLISVEVATHANREDKDGEFEIKASKALPEDVTISYSFSGTATKGDAYSTEPAGEQLVLKAGKTSAKVKVKKQKKVVDRQTVVLQLTAPAREGLVLDQQNDSATMEIQSQEEVEDVLLTVSVEKGAGEDSKDGFFEIAVSKAFSTDVTISYSLSGTAQRGSDYTTEPEVDQLVLKAGKTSIKVKIKPVADAEVEEEETITLTLQDPAVAGLALDEARKAATMQVQDNDEEVEVEDVLLSVVVDKDAAEDNKDGFFELKLSKALDTDLTIAFALSGTATAGTDYVNPGEQLVLKAGRTSEKIKVEVKADAAVEGDETVILSLQAPATAGVLLDEANKTASLKISDNDEEREEVEPALLSVAVAKNAAEDNKDGEFEISLSEAFPEDLVISYSLAGTATAGADYEAPEGQVVLKAGKKKEKIKVKVLADSEVEGDETVVLELAAPATAGVLLNEGKKAATLTIEDNDEEEVPVQVLLSVALEKNAAEDGKDGFFEISLSEALSADLTISYTLSGSATPGEDYEAPAGQLMIEAGKTSEKIKIAVQADAEEEEDETVVLTLDAPATDEVILDETRKAATLIIEDNDEEEEVEDVLLSVVKAKDAAEDNKDGAFTLRLSEALPADLSIRYSLSGTATAGADYEAAGEEVVLKAGDKQVEVAITVKADSEVEGDETVVLELVAPTQSGVILDVANKSASLNIKDDDKEEEAEPAILSVSVEKNAAEDDEDGAFEVKLSKALATDLSIAYTLSGTATAGTDFESPAAQLLIKAGQTSAKLTIAVKADEEAEQEETVILTLQAPAAEDVILDEAGKAATLKIRDNDEEQEVEPALLSVTVAKHAEEDNREGTFLISSSIALPVDVIISYSLAGSATADTDYVSPGGQVVLKAGQTSVEVAIKVKADTEAEGIETVVLSLQTPVVTGLLLDQNRKAATMNLLDNDEEEVVPAVLSVSVDRDATEDGQEGVFMIMLSEALDTDLTISYSLSGTATPGLDYESPAGQLVLKAGKTSEKVVVAVKADTEVEGDETVILSLQTSATEGVVLHESEKAATLKVFDNDEDDVEEIVFLSVAVGTDAAEGAEAGYFVISSSVMLQEDLTISYSLAGTAAAGADYVSPGGEVVLNKGRKSVKVAVEILDDEEVEEDETVVLSLQAPSIAGVALDEAKKSASLTIRDNDEEEEVVLALLSVAVDKDAAEDDKSGAFVLSLSKALDADLTIGYSLSGTAQRGSDYNTDPAADQLVLSAGQTSIKVAVNVLADLEVEAEETVVLELNAVTAAGVVIDETRQVATLTITDNDEEEVVEPVGTYAVLPTLFTPNGDQMNDAFVLHARNLRALHWRIYNRHGRLIYETTSIEDATAVGWDGTVNGEPQPEDSYIWILVYQENAPEAGSTKLTGSVTLIR
nr:Calx-beta domain-containing protein [Cesiribacter sp. SM1]